MAIAKQEILDATALAKLDRARLPFVSVLTDPTFGGTAASLALLGDIEAAVRWGEQTYDEMMVGFFDVAVPANLDKHSYFIRH